MLGPTKIYFIIFGLLTIAGGVMGYAKVGSTASLIAGSISGILLLVAAFVIPSSPVPGIILGGIVSLLLIGYFLPKFLSTHALMPAGMMSLLSIIGVIMAVLAWMRK
jgi:uncharacterized membrane protein (UPF0136 family)